MTDQNSAASPSSSSSQGSSQDSSSRKFFKRKDEEKQPAPWYIEIPVVMLITFALMFVVHTFIGRLYLIPSQSMEPTLHGCPGCSGDRIWVDKIAYKISDPEPGDVVVFVGTESWNNNFTSQRSENTIIRGLENLGSYIGLIAPDENTLVKRVVATGGQTISCQEGDEGVKVDGKVIDSSYILQPPAHAVEPRTGSEACGGPYFGPITVPAGHLFMMGDNRTNSADSRYHLGDQYQGTIPESNVVGKVQGIFLPLGRFGAVEDPDIQK
ncbi:signal peptidase I [Corynebacterium freiburgense]|uniref:signal peptidase I n=1 Tax=Corynebacterium freiburgense TaxID=556548 RepID=UPI000401449D|nr:signal peptidase I [Corynebacterium freiburgense]WJZ03031.1 Signal peptidase I [Corynebacterium freiburgense]